MEPTIVPPSLEVFAYGLAQANKYMKRTVLSMEYAGWICEWALTNPDDMKEAP
jgi:hypothetical protein